MLKDIRLCSTEGSECLGRQEFCYQQQRSVGSSARRAIPGCIWVQITGRLIPVTDGIEVTPCHLGPCHSRGLPWERLCRDAQVQLRSDLLKIESGFAKGRQGLGARALLLRAPQARSAWGKCDGGLWGKGWKKRAFLFPTSSHTFLCPAPQALTLIVRGKLDGDSIYSRDGFFSPRQERSCSCCCGV